MRKPLLLLFSTWGIYFVWLWPHILRLENQKLVAGHPYVWADWSMHIALASNFAFRPLAHWFDSLPVFAGAHVNYPFITNLISGLLLRIGFSLPMAFILPSIIFSLLAIYMLGRMFLALGYRRLVWLGVTVFLCSGGLGAFLLMRTLGVQRVLTDAIVVTTQIDSLQIVTNNIVASMLVPQRAYLLGLPIGIWIMLRVWKIYADKSKKSLSKWQVMFAGVAAGLMPIIHSHTYIVLLLFSVWIGLWSWKRWRVWLWFLLPAAMASLLVFLLFFRGSSVTSHFFSLNVGWEIHTHMGEWLLFWIKNWGVFFIGSIVGTLTLFYTRQRKLLVWTGFFWLLFLLANLIQFQPQAWDNTKLFAWVYLGLVPAWLAVLRVTKRHIFFMLFFVILTCGSGALDLFHNLYFAQKSFTMLTSEQLELGAYVRAHTAPSDVFLTRALVANPVSMWGGRSVLLGYPGWAFSYGLPFSEREQMIDAVLSSPKALMAQGEANHIQYIYLENNDNAKEIFIHLPKVFENSAGVIYQVKYF